MKAISRDKKFSKIKHLMMKLNGKYSTGNVLVLNVLTSGGHIGENLYALRLLRDTYHSRVIVLLHLIIIPFSPL